MGQARDQGESFAPAEACTPADWAIRLRRGDPSAAREVRTRVSRILQHGTLSIPDDEREDLEQGVLAEVWQAVNRTGFDFSGGFWGFVEVVTSRRCIDWLRTRKQSLPLIEHLPHSHTGRPLKEILEKERARLAADVLASLGAPCRKLITLKLHRDMRYSEISEILGKSEGALRVQFYRCIRSARKLLLHAIEPPEAVRMERHRP